MDIKKLYLLLCVSLVLICFKGVANAQEDQMMGGEFAIA